MALDFIFGGAIGRTLRLVSTDAQNVVTHHANMATFHRQAAARARKVNDTLKVDASEAAARDCDQACAEAKKGHAAALVKEAAEGIPRSLDDVRGDIAVCNNEVEAASAARAECLARGDNKGADKHNKEIAAARARKKPFQSEEDKMAAELAELAELAEE